MNARVEQRSYHGSIDTEDLARALVLRFDANETHAQWMRGEAGRAIVQVRNRRVESTDANTAVTVHVTPTATGVTVSVSEQQWLGMAADLARVGVKGWLNPMRLLTEFDNIARNVRWLRLRREVWTAVEEYAQSRGSGRGAAPMLKSVICPYCGTPNDIGKHNCKACRAPLTREQPIVCHQCGTLNQASNTLCVNCGARLQGG